MRRVLFILSLFMLVCGYIEARTIIVEIGNIRGNHGNILVMAQSGKWEKFDLSVFHDENENWQMDMLEGKGPAEGYALKSCEVKDEEATFKLKLYYPVNQ